MKDISIADSTANLVSRNCRQCCRNRVWQTARPALLACTGGPHLRIVDTRPMARRQDWTAGEMEAEVYRLCDSAQTPAALLKQISARREVSSEEVQTAIQTLCDAKVMLQMNGKLISLGTAAISNRNWYTSAVDTEGPSPAWIRKGSCVVFTYSMLLLRRSSNSLAALSGVVAASPTCRGWCLSDLAVVTGPCDADHSYSYSR